MSHLSPDDEAFLDLARDADDPSNEQRDRVRRRLAAKLGVAVTAISASTSASAASSTTAAASVAGTTLSASAALAVKVAVVLAVTSASASGVALYRSAREPSRPSVVLTPASAAPSSAPTHLLSPKVLPSSDVVAPPTPATVPVVAMPSVRAAPRPSSGAQPTTDVSSLEEETRLVQSGAAALRSGDAASALALFDEHARRFPRGVLAEERAAESVVALCALGRDAEARAAADRFLREHPNAPVAGKVRASCTGEQSDPR